VRRAVAGLGLALLLAVPAAGQPPEVWRERGREAVARAREIAPDAGTARNVVLFVGDGLGLSTVTAARILEGQLRGEPGEGNQLAFETLPHLALARVYNTNQQTPDSAGTMTAMLTGVKTRAGVLGVDGSVLRGDAAGVSGHELPTLLEQAEDRGLRTGIVSNTTVTHATPAAGYAHSPERVWEDDSRLSDTARALGFPDIARQLLEQDHGDGIDVALGGGWRHFLPARPESAEADAVGDRRDGRDLLAEWSARGSGARVVTDREALLAVDPATTDRLLGLFAPGHLAFEADRAEQAPDQPSLTEMTEAALALLENAEEGFVLVVEGGRIDHGHHLGNAYRALTETIELSNAVRAVLERTDPEETLVVVTADHGHTLTLGGYATRGNPILGKVVPNDARGLPADTWDRDGLGLPYTVLGYQNGPGYTGASDVAPEGPKHLGRELPTHFEGIAQGRPDLSGVDTADPRYVQEATVPKRSETHSGEDVPIYAGGPGAALFHGVQEQSYVYHALVEALGWNRTRPPRGLWQRLLGRD